MELVTLKEKEYLGCNNYAHWHEVIILNLHLFLHHMHTAISMTFEYMKYGNVSPGTDERDLIKGAIQFQTLQKSKKMPV